MKVCCGCRKPIPQCTCSTEERLSWEKAARQEKEQAVKEQLQYIEDLKQHRNKYSEEEYAQEMEWLEESLEEYQKMEDRYEDYSFEIDDDILDTILTLWDKGYGTRYCCAGHPNSVNNIYILFDNDYYFDFSNSGLDENWKYSVSGSLDYRPTQKALRQMDKDGIDRYTHLCEQRELLNRWVHQLPPARKRKKDEPIQGIWMKHRRTKKELEADKAVSDSQ